MKLDDLKKLHQKKYRTQFGYYLVEGEHLVLELQKASRSQAHLQNLEVYITSAHQAWAEQLSSSFKVIELNQKQMAQISDTKTPQGIVALAPLPKAPIATSILAKEQNAASSKAMRSIYLHEVQDPGNLGTILRTLAWFGNFRLLLSPNSVDPYNSKVVRASMGAIFHVPLEQDVTLEELQSRHQHFAFLDMQGSSIKSSQFAEHDCYLFGNEARGVPTEALAACNAVPYTIAGSGIIDSLNLASAVNICVYELSA